jgi:hypothetical protein
MNDYGEMVRNLMLAATPVVFDNFKKGRTPMGEVQAPPAVGPMGGGGGGGWNVSRYGGSSGGAAGSAVKPLPSGGQLKVRIERDAAGQAHGTVTLAKKRGYDRAQGSAKDAIRHFGEAADALKEFSTKVRPKTLRFEAGDSGLGKFYDKVAPRLAEGLGANLSRSSYGSYGMTFPNAKAYAPNPPATAAPAQAPSPSQAFYTQMARQHGSQMSRWPDDVYARYLELMTRR